MLTPSLFTVGLLAAYQLVNVWPRNTYTPLLLGAVLQSVGMGVLAWALYVERKPVIYGMMALVGAGSGFRLLCRKCMRPCPCCFFQLTISDQVTIHAIGMFPDQVATVVSLVAVANPLGGTLGHTMMSTVFNNVVDLGSTDDLMSDLNSFQDLPAGELSDIAHRVKVRMSLPISLYMLRIIRRPVQLTDADRKDGSCMGICCSSALDGNRKCPFSDLDLATRSPANQGILAAFFLGTVILPEGKGSEENRRANVIIREPYFLALLRAKEYQGVGDQLESEELVEGANSRNDNANGKNGSFRLETVGR